MRKLKRVLYFALWLYCFSMKGWAQSTANRKPVKEEQSEKKKVITTATFKSTRLINGHSVETVKRGMMDFRIHHRFGFLNQGINDLFGLDNATTFIGFDFGVTDRLTLGINRSSYLRQLETVAKYRLLQQSKGFASIPLSLTLVTAAVLRTGKQTDPSNKRTFKDRTSYVSQLIIARKFCEGFSLQLVPTFVHFNYVPGHYDPNNLFSLGVGARQKISKRISLNAEYYYQFDKFEGFRNSVAVGVDISTAGHVFQLHLTNSTGMTEPSFIHQTTGRWNKGDIHFGFNVSRMFSLKKK